MSHLVTARDLNKLIDSKLRERRAAFETILSMCMNKVKRYAQRRQYRCVFEVPEVILGEPLYKLPEAIAYVAKHLKDDCGFYVRLFVPRLLYVSWDMDEITGKKVMQPLVNRLVGGVIAEVPAMLEHRPEFHPSMIQQNSPVFLGVPSPLPPPIASRPRARLREKKDEDRDVKPEPPVTRQLRQPQQPQQPFNEIAGCKPSGKFILNLS